MAIETELYTDPEAVTPTEQSHAKSCDINNIMAKYIVSGTAEQRAEGMLFGDFTSVESYQNALEAIESAKADFASLPAELRERWSNNPEFLIDWLAQPENQAEAIELGIIPAT